MHDTDPEATRIQIAAFRDLSPEARVALAFEASEWIMAVARARTAAAPLVLTDSGATSGGGRQAAGDASAP